jgi:hypothetical protein
MQLCFQVRMVGLEKLNKNVTADNSDKGFETSFIKKVIELLTGKTIRLKKWV